MELEGDFKQFKSFKEALSYLKQNKYGYLHHPIMERNSFIFLQTNGRPYWYDSAKDAIEILEKADLIEFNDPTEWLNESRGKPQWGYVPGGETALTAGGEEWFRSLRETQAQIESYCIVGTTSSGAIELIEDTYTYPEALAAIETFEGTNPRYVGYDIFTESRFDRLVKKMDGFVQPDHMENDLVDEIKSKRQKRVDAKKKPIEESTDSGMISDIAKRLLGIDSLETQHNDRLDFHEVSVWSLKEALEAAYEAGRNFK